MTVFETRRLRVRQLKLTDFAAFHEMQANPRVMQYTTGVAQSAETNRAQLQQCIDGYAKPETGFLVWAVDERPDGPLVGTCAVVRNDQGENELGYRLLESHWGHGYGREILDGLIEYCLGPLAMDSLVAYVDKRNAASVRILETSPLEFDREQVDANGWPELRFTKTKSGQTNR